MANKRQFWCLAGMGPIILAAVFAVEALAGNLDFLSGSAVSYLREDDTKLMMNNAFAALDASDPAAQRNWNNPRTGASGRAQVRGEFVGSDGALCKRLRMTTRTKKAQGEATYTFCKYPGRGWLINADAQPK